MNIFDYTDCFFRIEERLGLFHDRVDGQFWWDIARHDVFNHVFRSEFGVRLDSAPPNDVARRARGLAERARLRIRLWLEIRAHAHEVIVFRAPRQRRDGRRIDPAVDHLVNVCPGRHLIIDTVPHYYHRRELLKFNRRPTRPGALDDLLAAFDTEMGIQADKSYVEALVLERLSDFVQARADYIRLFSCVRPRFVLLSQNGIEKAMFSAARELGIPLIEAQHGLINRTHPAYSYSPRIDYRGLDTFPKVFLTFSSYWSDACYYPVEHCVAIGNDDFFVERSTAEAGREDVIFISADIYHKKLAPWLKAAAERLPARSFKYKLHPNQHADFETVRDELAVFPNVEVVPGDVPARQLLEGATCVVMISSTLAYEAVQSGRRLCIIPEMNYQVHEDLFGLSGVTVPLHVDELVDSIAASSQFERSVTFFDRFNESRATELIKLLFERGSLDSYHPSLVGSGR